MTQPGPPPPPKKYSLDDYLLSAERAEADTRRQAAIVAGASAEAAIARAIAEVALDIDRDIERSDQDRPGMWTDDLVDHQEQTERERYDEPPLPPISAPHHK